MPLSHVSGSFPILCVVKMQNSFDIMMFIPLLGAQDMHVVCRIFQKVGSGPQNGAQYGAPYMEEEWEDEDDAIENTPTSGTSTEMLAITDTASAESNVEDENIFSGINELVQVRSCLCYPSVRY